MQIILEQDFFDKMIFFVRFTLVIQESVISVSYPSFPTLETDAENVFLIEINYCPHLLGGFLQKNIQRCFFSFY